MKYPTGDFKLGDLVEVVEVDKRLELFGTTTAHRFLGRKLYISEINPYGQKLPFGLTVKAPMKLDDGSPADMAICVYCSLDQIRHTTLEEPSTVNAMISKSDRNPRGPARKVRCIQTGKVYNTLKEASKDTGVSDTAISLVLNKHRENVKGLTWEYAD